MPNIIVVGAGILGLSSAYHLKERHPEKEILLVDMGSAAGQGNTALSAECFRNVFSSKSNFLLADTSIDFYRHVQNDLGYDLGIEMLGYLWLLSKRQYDSLEAVFGHMKKKGIELKTYETEDLKQMVPTLVLDPSAHDEEAEILDLAGIDKGVLGTKCGSLKVDRLVKFYEENYKRMGGKALYNTRVRELIVEPTRKLGIPGEPFLWQDKRITGIRTDKGEFYGDTIVLVPGVWACKLLDPIGIDSLIKPRKTQIFVVKHPSLDPLLNMRCSFLLLPKPGMYLRPLRREKTFWCGYGETFGTSLKFEEEPKVEERHYYDNSYPILKKYLPPFENIRPTNMWAGSIALNTIDGNPYIFERGGAIVAVGTSGSGIMKGDAVGRIVAALYDGEEYAELYDNISFKVSDLGLESRVIEREEFVIGRM